MNNPYNEKQHVYIVDPTGRLGTSSVSTPGGTKQAGKTFYFPYTPTITNVNSTSYSSYDMTHSNFQQKAFDMKLTHSGTVIHRVTAQVDAGPIVMHDTVKIVECKTVDQVIDKLKKQSIKSTVKIMN